MLNRGLRPIETFDPAAQVIGQRLAPGGREMKIQKLSFYYKAAAGHVGVAVAFEVGKCGSLVDVVMRPSACRTPSLIHQHSGRIAQPHLQRTWAHLSPCNNNSNNNLIVTNNWSSDQRQMSPDGPPADGIDGSAAYLNAEPAAAIRIISPAHDSRR